MKEIDNIVKKVLMESLNEKAEELTKKIKGEMEGEFDYVQEKECMEGDCGEMEEGKKFRDELKKAYSRKHPNEKYPESLKKKYSTDDDEDDEDFKSNLDEKLFGGQKKLDVAEPKGKITKADFDKLRSMKKETKEDYEMEEPMMPGEGEKRMKNYRRRVMQQLLNLYPDDEHLKNELGIEDENGEMEEGNAFLGARADAKDQGKKEFEFDGETYPVKESFKYSIKFDGEELILSEEELVNMIEEIVLEEKKSNLKSSGGRAKGTVEYDRVHKKDEDINKKANQESFKKMREYVKAGSKGSFEENPKFFPKGNGQLAKMDKKAYVPSEAVDEYIDTFAYGGGMLDLDPDEIGYNEDWLEKTIEGSEMTGNSPKYANAEDTGLGKKLNKRRKLGLYNQEKRQSYKRVKQPVDVAGEDTKSGKLNKMFKNLGESTEEKEILSEEMSKMKNMMGYNKKTQ